VRSYYLNPTPDKVTVLLEEHKDNKVIFFQKVDFNFKQLILISKLFNNVTFQ